MKENKVIGITGGVGSGKSTVSKILEEDYGAYIINTDDVAHKLMEKGQISYNYIKEYFGPSILDENDNIDRAKLGVIVYKDANELLKLNSFTHPYVMDQVKIIIKQKQKENYNYVAIETALPQEAKLKDICDEIWFVYASQASRAKRLKAQRNYTDEKIICIMDKQLTSEEYKTYSTHIIINENGEKLKEQIEKIFGT